MVNIHLTNEDYEKILQFISMIRDEKDDYQYSVLKCLSKLFAFDHLAFHLINEEGRFTSSLGLNISSKLFQLYSEYYFKTDIFHPVNVSSQLIMSKNTFTITDLMSLQQFENTEYYNDFLKTDNLFYEIAMPLKLDQKLIGAIAIFRPREDGNFTPKDRKLLSNLSTHIAFHLNEYLETMQIRNEQQIYKNCISQLPFGLVVLDNNWNIVSSNNTAKVYCYDLLNNENLQDPVSEMIKSILPNISFQSINPSTVIYNDLESYDLKIVPSIVPNINKGIETYYLLYLIKKTPHNQLKNLQSPVHHYNLTDRELEIVQLIAQGLSNKEIAATLFLSTNTIRTHVNNIFNKLSVSNRTAILYKMGMIQKAE